MRKRIATLIVICSAVSSATSVGGQEISLEALARTPFVDHMPYEIARRRAAEGPSRVSALLSDRSQADHWANAVVILGMVGDSTTFDTLRAFLLQPSESTLSGSEYRARSVVMLAMGYLVNHSNDRRAIAFLVAAADPGTWSRIGLTWRSPFHDDRAALEVSLSNAALLGLALTGRQEAVAELRRLSAGEGVARSRTASAMAAADYALRQAIEVRRVGLEAYHRPKRQ